MKDRQPLTEVPPDGTWLKIIDISYSADGLKNGDVVQTVRLSNNYIYIKGSGSSGWYPERFALATLKEVLYHG